MLRSVTVTNPTGVKETISLTTPWVNRIAIESIDGLGPVQATLNTSAYASRDGGRLNSTRLETRAITINFIIVDGPDIEERRLAIYALFPPKGRVELEFETDHRRVMAEAYVESVSPSIFSDMAKVQVGILCMDPYFHSAEAVEVEYYGVIPKFEFPYLNEGTHPNTEFSIVQKDVYRPITYLGEVATGISAIIKLNGLASGLSIHNTTYHESLRLNDAQITTVTGTIRAGDEIHISTVSGHKSIQYIRQGESFNLLSAVEAGSSWIQVYPGDNVFAFDATSGLDNCGFSLRFHYLFTGV